MSVIGWNPTGNLTHYQGHEEFDRLPYVHLSKEGWRYFSGSDVRVYFGDVRVSEMDSFGLQLAQNIAPVYGYHSHIWQGLQYGAKLVQGYFRLHLVDAAYLPTILDAVERERIVGEPELYQQASPGKINTGKSLAQAVAQFGANDNWAEIADAYDAAQWGHRDGAAAISAKTPYALPRPLVNDFTYNAYGTTLRRQGFTISLVFGDLDTELAGAATAKEQQTLFSLGGKDHRLYGTAIRLYEAHIVAGPNMQIEVDGKPLAGVYTFIARDMT